jgi:hypothetical protein
VVKTVCIDGPKYGEVVEVAGKEWKCPLPRKAFAFHNVDEVSTPASSSIDVIMYHLGYVTFEMLQPLLVANIIERTDIGIGVWSDARLIENKGKIDIARNCYWVWTTKGFGK